ncbi:MAG TPA: class I mannose-6-phosphate isomerase [Phycisphaerae bacterium]|nr:class I mannose-6-phosphate isomerase [Phycisphaerae bacterium]
MDLYPLTFEPIYVPKIWGGRNLERLFARRLPPGEPIGESWELADLPSAVSVVRNGPLAGRGLHELTRSLGPALLGEARPAGDGRFPLLLKLLDANDILSLQVHPDARAAAEIGGTAVVKSECWYVVESRGGFIYDDLLPGTSLERFRRAVEQDQAERFVRRLDVAAGEFHRLPAGTVHALGAGVVVAEVQTPSDTTYRVTDWGRGREIHVEQSMRCIRVGLDPPGARASDPDSVDMAAFRVRRRRLDAGAPLDLPPGRLVAAMVLAAAPGTHVRHAGGVLPRVDLAAGDTVLLPAALQAVQVVAGGPGLLLEITLGETGDSRDP